MRFLLSPVLVFFFCAHADALQMAVWNQAATRQLDELLETMHENRQFNGTVLLAEAGNVVYEKTLGVANINEVSVLTAESSFRLASVSKQFTAMGIMLLCEQGKLQYDDDIRKYIPELPYEGITIRHLLHHTGGLPDYVSWFAENWDADKPESARKTAFNSDLVEQFAKHKPGIEFLPGERFEYSNTGYVLLAVIVERVSGVPVKQFFRERIFDLLEMQHTSAFSPGEDFVIPQRVFGFAWTGDGDTHQDNDWNFLNGMNGDGGIYASARDLLKWDQALYTEKIVKQSTLAEAFTSGKISSGEETGYGFGWMVESSDGIPVRVAHGGGWVGFRTSIDRDLQNRRTAIVLTNHSSFFLDAILKAIDDIRTGKPAAPPVQVAPEILESYVGRYELAADFVITITREGDTLLGQATGQPRFVLLPVTKNSFSVVGVDARITFGSPDAGPISELTLHQGGVDQTAKKLKQSFAP